MFRDNYSQDLKTLNRQENYKKKFVLTRLLLWVIVEQITQHQLFNNFARVEKYQW